jgi:hypothetical protein
LTLVEVRLSRSGLTSLSVNAKLQLATGQVISVWMINLLSTTTI